MKTIAIKTMVSILLFSSSIFASSQFENFNLYNTQWSTFKHLRVVDQGSLAACYSYASAQMAEFNILKNYSSSQKYSAQEMVVSPLWSAFLFKDKSKHIMNIFNIHSNNFSYGSSMPTVKQLEKYGVCNNEIIEQNMREMGKDVDLNDGNFSQLVKNVHDNINEPTFESLIEKIKNAHYTDTIKIALESYYDEKFRNVDAKDISDAKLIEVTRRVYTYLKSLPEDVLKAKFINFAEKTYFKNCDNNRFAFKLDHYKSKAKWFKSDKKVKKIIQEAFEDNDYSEPLAIGYCSNIYNKKDDNSTVKYHSKLAPRLLDRSIIRKNNCSPHYSLLVGRRQVGDSKNYELLVRNTYGNRYMYKASSCECYNKNTQTKEVCGVNDRENMYAPKHLEMLGCWLPEKQLYNHIYDVSWFSSRK